MIVAFSGHRDKLADKQELINTLLRYPGCTVIHGGAPGFDRQVDAVSREIGLVVEVIKPDYARYGKAAPLIRNKEILQKCNALIALYDGRKSGGTYFTINEAHKIGLPVSVLSPSTSS